MDNTDILMAHAIIQSMNNIIKFPDGVEIVITDAPGLKKNYANIEQLRAKIGKYIYDSNISNLNKGEKREFVY
jgi:hypothetical protein